jgi:aminoglycoside phosphotransferase (APT) family kinase protein
MYKFIIFDDEAGEVAKLADYLGAAYPPPLSRILHADAVSDWRDVEFVISKHADARDVVAFFDLNLSSGSVAEAGAGLEHVREFRAQQKRWTFVSYSRFDPLVGLLTDPDECFDGTISKQELSPMKRPERIAYVKEHVDDAVSRRAAGGRVAPPDATIVDSFGMRVFRATFGDGALNEVLHNEAGDWPTPTVAALTSGHSGAHILRISHGSESLVLKLAKSFGVIAHEIQAVKANLSRLGAFAGKLAPLDMEKKTLSNGAVYYRQADVSGESALDRLLKGSTSARASILQRLVRLCVETAGVYSRGRSAGRPPFSLTPVDRGRFTTSVEFLVTLAKSLARHGALRQTQSKIERVAERALRLVDQWDNNRVVAKKTFLVLQHGDLNPGNVLITSSEDIVLIDLARFEDWPPGYDLSRLALLLRLRLIDRTGHEDWLPYRLSNWQAEHVARFRLPSHTLCEEARVCDIAFREFVAGARAADRGRLEHGYQLGSLWDLVKVVSYQDASQFKRLWALFELDDLGRLLGAIPAA